MDKYEASVWRVPDATGGNKGLVAKIRKGKATAADLSAGGATQLGTASDDYAPCTDNGQNCTDDVFAASLPGLTPSRFISWFQARAACKNARKRLPTNAEWQDAVIGTPDPGGDNGTTDCKTAGVGFTPTGSRSACVSADGAFDMVGNAGEWVADWVPASTGCTSWGTFSNDFMCLSGADATATGPGAPIRGGFTGYGSGAGPFAIEAVISPALSFPGGGFRCAR